MPACSISSPCSSAAATPSAPPPANGFSLTGGPALLLFALIVLYFYLGWKVLGGTLWQRILGAR
ncbi:MULTISPECIES: hypothetical protein [unclassified Bradyrhizobium]|uniref:hypothetical protein n=1 Tax=unclassified Bradyrhizobium TaxID=2631580 RepID=UPI002010CC46|nr:MULTISPECIES: hypothetical protein [unclassified Bradyrhizobium]